MCGENTARYFAHKDGYAHSRCTACGYLFLDPMPSREELARMYRGEAGVTIESYPKASSRMYRAFIKAVKFVRFIRGRDVIDVGCGGGFVVEAMRRVGARTVGLDLSPPSIAYARRRFPECEFACGTAEDFARAGRTFDFIYCSEVMEHVPNPESFAAALAQLCRPGGYLFVTTPDIGHWRVPKDLVSWNLVYPPQHVSYFTAKSLGLLLARHGFALRRKFFKLKPGLQVLAQRL